MSKKDAIWLFISFMAVFAWGIIVGMSIEESGRYSEMKSSFDKLRETDMVYFIEEKEGSFSHWVDSKELHEKISSNSLPEGARVTKFQLIEKTTVTKRIHMERVKDEENSKEKKD